MRWIRFLFLLTIVTLINASSLLDLVSIGAFNIKPDLLLILMVFFAINCNTKDAILSCFAIGAAADISSTAMTVGPGIISFVIFGGAVSFLQRSVIMSRFIFQVISIFLVGLLTGVMTQVLVFTKLSGYTYNSIAVIAMVGVYSALIGPFVWLFLSKIFNQFVDVQPLFGRSTEK